MSKKSIHIRGVQGDVIGVGVSGTGNIVGRNVTVSSGLRLDPDALSRMPAEYAASLQAFSENVNRQLSAHRVPAEKISPVQNEVDALSREVGDLKPDKPVSIIKAAGITTKLAAMAKGLLKILPQTAETIATFTPLAPFGKLIGTGIEEVIKSVREEN
jgi:hypothetical protein